MRVLLLEVRPVDVAPAALAADAAGLGDVRVGEVLAGLLVGLGDLTVTEVCFEVGCSSLGTFSTRFTELVGVPPTVYREESADATDGIPACLAKNITRPIRNREAQRG